MKMIQFLVLFIIVVGALSITSLALAQSSQNFDLGCWGAVNSGGDRRQSTSVIIQDAVGQWTGGVASSANVVLRGGYVQNWVAQPTPTPQPTVLPSGEQKSYLPWIANYVSIVRFCR
ncbi:MAG: hypothetical protein U0350_21830 [Caldilineaceae bacterium]